MATAQPIPLRVSTCRFCGTPLERSFVDLGAQPLTGGYLRHADLTRMEAFYPLHAHVCGACKLVQLEDCHGSEQLFGDYASLSSYPQSRLRHAEAYCDAMIRRFGLGSASQVVEIAGNDGHLLQLFARRGVPVLGIEPAANVARAAEQKGVPTRVGFFGRRLARALAAQGTGADLLIANNVLAHVPDLNDFVAALRIALNPGGVLTVEFPDLSRLVEDIRFDMIRHERFSYFSFATVERVFAAHGIIVFDAEELPGHGGALRAYGCHSDEDRAVGDRVERLRAREAAHGPDRIAAYDGFGARVARVKRRLLAFLIEAKEAGGSIAAYGAEAGGSALLNYCGIGPDMVDFAVDATPHRQGLFLPGSHIPVVAPERIAEARPDYLLILPGNPADEIIAANAHIRDWGARFVVPTPAPRLIP